MSGSDGDLIVVGVDGSEGGRRALAWALREANRRGSAVEVVTVWNASWPEPGNPDAARAEAEREQTEAIGAAIAGLDGPAPAISREIAGGDPAEALTQAAGRAAFLVLGSHGYGVILAALLGSVTQECIKRAVCPVLVVPTLRGRGGPHDEVAASARTL